MAYNPYTKTEMSDEEAKSGKSAIRPYLYGSKLATQYGMSQKDIDNIIRFDNATKEVSIGGKNIGKPYSIVDGVSYWDSSYLDSEIDDYIKRSGITPTVTLGQLISKTNKEINDYATKLGDLQLDDHKNMSKKYDELYDFGMNTNPLETETGKAIMADYNLKAMQGRDNEVASGAASNGGNIDSFAAANALRQQAALTAKGQQQAIAAQTQRINDVRSILGDMGAYQQGSYAGMRDTIGVMQGESQRLFDNQETEKLNNHGINVDVANITGYVPKDWSAANNPFFNSDGTLKSEETDYQAIIDNANEELKTATDPKRIADLQATIEYANEARHYKVNNYGGKYAKYADTLVANAPKSTLARDEMEAANKLAEKTLDYNQMLGLGEINATKYAADKDLEGVKYAANVKAAQEQNEEDDADMASYTGLIGYYTNGLSPTAKGAPESKMLSFVQEKLKPYFEGKKKLEGDAGFSEIVNLVLDNTEKYNIDVSDARLVLESLGFPHYEGEDKYYAWLDNYEDRTGEDKHKGMKKKTT